MRLVRQQRNYYKLGYMLQQREQKIEWLTHRGHSFFLHTTVQIQAGVSDGQAALNHRFIQYPVPFHHILSLFFKVLLSFHDQSRVTSTKSIFQGSRVQKSEKEKKWKARHYLLKSVSYILHTVFSCAAWLKFHHTVIPAAWESEKYDTRWDFHVPSKTLRVCC